ncbi:MAG: hypothetical protein QM541_15955 [Flavobacterium sp.]|nr:hypothetical protein [Flavobacterium sp.]MDI9366450.1 hypothetical protein [Flavobacterium sp.]
MSYQGLLDSDEWRNKRDLVVKRDNFCCQRCFNRRLIENHTIYRFLAHRLSIVEGRSFIVATIFKGGNFNDTFTIFLNPDFFETIFDNGHQLIFLIDDTLKDENTYLNYTAIFGFGLNSEVEYNKCKNQNDFKSFNNWIDVKGLHVHHTFYQEGKVPWDYPEKSLITLCKYCHEDLHQTVAIRVCSSNYLPLEQRIFIACTRCNGTGYIHQYKHVEAGICFACNGERYLT